MKSETIDESKYPMTYEEFEKRVIELFLDGADSHQELEFRKYFLKEEVGDLIEGGYKEACYRYDSSDFPSNQFSDEGLLRQPVRILEMI